MRLVPVTKAGPAPETVDSRLRPSKGMGSALLAGSTF
jgi:hypothetical protein